MAKAAAAYEFKITPPKGLVYLNFGELWRYRELFFVFVWRDIKVKYKQTVLGVAWAIFQPVVTMIVFNFFFAQSGKVSSENNVPYPIFVYTGLLFWTYASTALTNATNSLITDEGIIKKVYFPRLILPISTSIVPIIDFAIACVILFLIMAYYSFWPGLLGIIAIPFLVLFSLLSAAGLGLLFAALNVKFRDVRYVLPFFIQLLLFLTPVIYPVTILPSQYQWVLYLNPMTGVIVTARHLLLNVGTLDIAMLGISLASAVIIFLLGITYFRKTERFFADLI